LKNVSVVACFVIEPRDSKLVFVFIDNFLYSTPFNALTAIISSPGELLMIYTCCPSMSVSRARFVTDRAIDMKLLYICTHWSDDLRYQISVQSDSWIGHQGAKAENTISAINYSRTNGWIISKFTIPIFLI
jgi:hypothetical protein